MISARVRATARSPPLDPAAPLDRDFTNLYRTDLGADAVRPTSCSRPPGGDGAGLGGHPLADAGAGEDLSHVFYFSTVNQTDPPDSPPTGGLPASSMSGARQGEAGCARPGGCLRLASVDPGGAALRHRSDLTVSALHHSSSYAEPRRLRRRRADLLPKRGRLRWAAAETAACNLYLREDGAAHLRGLRAGVHGSPCGADDSADRPHLGQPRPATSRSSPAATS